MTKTAEERAREIVARGPLVTLSVAERYIELIASALRQTERAVWLSAAEVADKRVDSAESALCQGEITEEEARYWEGKSDESYSLAAILRRRAEEV